jgi:hypothetical protein
MSEETSESKPVTTQSSKPEETSVQRVFKEGKAAAAGEQGILLQPVGSHHTDPFVLQDVSPAVGSQPSPPTASVSQNTDSSSPSTTQGGAKEE